MDAMRRQLLRVTRLILWLTTIVLTFLITVLLVRAFDARRGPALKLWHTEKLAAEFQARDRHTVKTLADYLARENALFAELNRKITAVLPPQDQTAINRYAPGYLLYPAGATNWNRTVVLAPKYLHGGMLLLHGLTDAPYSLKHVAEHYRDQGYYVLVLRVPGHGTIPSALVRTRWRDWLAAVELGARHVRTQIGLDRPLYFVGYSNGGALALKYALDAAERADLPQVDGLVLISPMIGISRSAVLARWIALMGEIPCFEKSRWLDFMPEYLPYKYNSFPANAAYQSHLISRDLRKEVLRQAKSTAITNLPPVLTFQSIVDATVSTPAVVDALYNHLCHPRDEMVLFNVNTRALEGSFIRPTDLEFGRTLLGDRTRHFRLCVITNRDTNSAEVVELSVSPGATQPRSRALGLQWPEEVYSLAHIALPINGHCSRGLCRAARS